jgi:hypothetical protein
MWRWLPTNARTWEYLVFASVFLIRLMLSRTEKRPYSYCADGFTHFLQIGATMVILYIPTFFLSAMLSKFTHHIPRLGWAHPWVVRTRIGLYILAVAGVPSCFLSQAMLRFWRFK